MPDGRLPATETVRLLYRPPFDGAGLLDFLATRAVPGVEECDLTSYRRVLALPRGLATVTLTPADGYIDCALRLADPADRDAALRRCRHLFGLDADPLPVIERLGPDPVLGPLVAEAPGRRVPGCADGTEIAVRAVLGQQVSVAGARTLAARLAAALGARLALADGTLTHAFPTAGAIAGADDSLLAMPTGRRRAVTGLATTIAEGRLDLEPGADRAEARRALLAVPGIGPWTADYIAMRALGDPDVFLPTDLAIRRAVTRLGTGIDHAEAWRPWRSYAVMHLWASKSPKLS